MFSLLGENLFVSLLCVLVMIDASRLFNHDLDQAVRHSPSLRP